jgi:hypothetical protein
VFTRPQLVAIEVLSPEDRHSKVQEKIEDYRLPRSEHLDHRSGPANRLGLPGRQLDAQRAFRSRGRADLR